MIKIIFRQGSEICYAIFDTLKIRQARKSFRHEHPNATILKMVRMRMNRSELTSVMNDAIGL